MYYATRESDSTFTSCMMLLTEEWTSFLWDEKALRIPYGHVLQKKNLYMCKYVKINHYILKDTKTHGFNNYHDWT